MPPIDGTDFSQLQMLIAALSQMGGGINPDLMASAYPANVSPSGVKSSFSPEVLLSSGLVSPETIAQLSSGMLGGLQSKYAGNIQSQLPPEATDIALYPVTSKYLGNDDLSDFMRSTLAAIGSGKVTPADALIKINKDKNVPAVVKTNLVQVAEDIDKYAKLVEGRNFARAKFDYEQQGKIGAAGPAPTMEDARMALFDKLGVPQMALLGDPNATYQFDPSGFVNQGRLSTANEGLRQAMLAQDIARGGTRGAIQAGKAEQDYTMKAIADLARKRGEEAVSGMKGKSSWTEDLGSTLGTTLAGSVIGPGTGLIGGITKLVTGSNDKKYAKAKEDAMKLAVEQERNRLISELPPVSEESWRIKYSPEYRVAKAKTSRAKSGVSMEKAYGRLVSEALEKELAARGVTPYSQNINDLLGYAVQTARK